MANEEYAASLRVTRVTLDKLQREHDDSIEGLDNVMRVVRLELEEAQLDD